MNIIRTIINAVAQLFKKQPPQKPQPVMVKVLLRDPCRLRMNEWRADPAMVKIARKYLDTAEFRLMLDVLERESPANFTLLGNVPSQTRAEVQCRIEGYTMAITNLEMLGLFEQPVSPLEATFEQPEEEKLK